MPMYDAVSYNSKTFHFLMNSGILSLSKSTDKNPKQFSSKANSFEKRRNHFALKVKGLWMNAQRAVLFLFGTHHIIWLPGKARDRCFVFIRWEKSGRNKNGGSSNQQQCLLCVIINIHTKRAIRSRHCKFVMEKRNFVRSEISYFVFECLRVCARTSTMFLQFHKLNFLHNMRLCKMTHIHHSGTERATSEQKERERVGGTSKRILSFSFLL